MLIEKKDILVIFTCCFTINVHEYMRGLVADTIITYWFTDRATMYVGIERYTITRILL